MSEPMFEVDEYDEAGNLVATYVHSDGESLINQDLARIDVIVRFRPLNHHLAFRITTQHVAASPRDKINLANVSRRVSSCWLST